MEYSLEDLSPLKKELKCTFPAEQVNGSIKVTITMYKKNVKLNGFRQGKVPDSVILERFYDSVYKSAKEDLINVAIETVMQEQNLRPINGWTIVSETEFKDDTPSP
ncbi:MAG: trigger factor family protein [Desulfovibrio sp.]|nr:trigger factor family protein [Desulfovibrio sp.]